VVFGATVTCRRGRQAGPLPAGRADRGRRQGRADQLQFSPLGRALIGRQVGDEVEVTTPSGDRYYEIKKIEFV
jgi:transcription elongation factor GreA